MDKTISYGGINFIKSPYEAGILLREDVLYNQFEIIFDGFYTFPEDNSIYDTYDREGYLLGGNAGHIHEAINLASEIVKNGSYEFREPETDYYYDEMGRDMGPLDFLAVRVYIKDRHEKQVVAGKVENSRIKWAYPVYSSSEITAIRHKQKTLSEKASYESGMRDNYSTARSLRTKADDLELHLSCKSYEEYIAKLNIELSNL